jgi:tetratricopeptide (TPR) repeat protein
MKKIILFLSVFMFTTLNAYGNTGNVIVPGDTSWTDRFILTELKELRIWLESTKREIYSEIQARQIETVDKALSYSANTVNFLFVLITIIVMWFWVVGWRTIWEIKQSTKESMDRETKKIITNFQKKIVELEKEQQINVLWRQFNLSDSDVEKLDILDKIHKLKPDSQSILIERWNIYLSMWLFEQVIENSDQILSSDWLENQTHALYNRICSYLNIWEIDKAVSDINHLLQLSPEYKDIILESDHLSSVLSNAKIKKVLK